MGRFEVSGYLQNEIRGFLPVLLTLQRPSPARAVPEPSRNPACNPNVVRYHVTMATTTTTAKAAATPRMATPTAATAAAASQPTAATPTTAPAAASQLTAATPAPTRATAVRILGIDPGLADCGWGVIEARGARLKPLAYGCISTLASEKLPQRLKTIADELRAVVRRYQPTDLGIDTVYQKGNSRSAIATAQARGAALTAAAELELRIGEYPPSLIKNAVVGNGAASKEQIQYMVQVLLKLDHRPTPDHAADALAAAICHAHLRKAPL
jgi:crossover junction endodeoxyribonuclease RuvC